MLSLLDWSAIEWFYTGEMVPCFGLLGTDCQGSRESRMSLFWGFLQLYFTFLKKTNASIHLHDRLRNILYYEVLKKKIVHLFYTLKETLQLSAAKWSLLSFPSSSPLPFICMPSKHPQTESWGWDFQLVVEMSKLFWKKLKFYHLKKSSSGNLLVFHKSSPFHICALATVPVFWNSFLSVGDIYSVVISLIFLDFNPSTLVAVFIPLSLFCPRKPLKWLLWPQTIKQDQNKIQITEIKKMGSKENENRNWMRI